MLINEFHKKFTNRFLGNFLNPVIIHNDDLNLPKRIVLGWYSNSPVNFGPGGSDNLLKSFRKTHIVSDKQYYLPEGNVKVDISKIKSALKSYKKSINNKNFKTYAIDTTKYTVSSTDALVYNSGLLTSCARYTFDTLNPYYKVRNTLKTVLYNLVNTNTRHKAAKFINIPVPDSLPALDVINKHVSDQVTKATLTHFDTHKKLVLLELCKWLTVDTHKESVFSYLKLEDLEDLYFVFTHNTNSSFIRADILISGVKGLERDEETDFEIKPSFSQTNDKSFRKLFLTFIVKNIIGETTPLHILDDEAIGRETLSVSSITDDSFNIIAKEIMSEETSSIPDDITEEDKRLLEADNEDELDIVNTEKIDAYLDAYIDKTETPIEIFENLQYFKDFDLNSIDDLGNKLNMLNESNNISPREFKKVSEVLEEQPSWKLYEDSDETLADLLKEDPKDYELKEEDIKLPDNIAVQNKEMLKDTLGADMKTYMKNSFRKDIIKSIYNIQRNNVIIQSHKVEKVETTLGNFEEHTIQLRKLKGVPSTIKFKYPVPDDEGTFEMSANPYLIRKQSNDSPIKKTKFNEVVLTSTKGKLFITKASKRNNDIGSALYKHIVKKSEELQIGNIISKEEMIYDLKLPLHYSIFSRYMKSFQMETKHGHAKFEFNFLSRDSLGIDLTTVDTKKEILIGTAGKKIITMDFDNNIYFKLNGKILETTTLFKLVQFKPPFMEFSELAIFRKNNISLGLLLSYYLALDNLLKLIGAKYTVVSEVIKKTPEEDKFLINFSDKTYIIEHDYGENDLLLGGINYYNKFLIEYPAITLNNRNTFSTIFNMLNFSPIAITELKHNVNLFIDPIMASLLKEMNEPVKFEGLLIRSNELLASDDYLDYKNAESIVYKGYDRFAGIAYNELTKALRDSENKSHISLDPYGVWKLINSDSTSMLVEDYSPISAIKQKHETTYLGHGGRDKATLVRNSRRMHHTQIGVVSEAGKDSSNVGINEAFSANPNLINTRGMVKSPTNKLETSQVFSLSALLSPYFRKDDMKRIVFTGIQHSHIAPFENMKVSIVRTPHDSILPSMVSKKFALVARKDGEVTFVNNDKIKIRYKGEEKEQSFKIGFWTGKEEAGICYSHNLITDLPKGHKFKAGEYIYYHSKYFAKDFFNPKAIVHKNGIYTRTALLEKKSTYEDSKVFDESISEKMATKPVKVISIIATTDDKILDVKPVGYDIKIGTPYFNLTDKNVVTDDKISEDSLNFLASIKRSNTKAYASGNIVKIEINYNCELENLDKTFIDLIKSKRISSKQVTSEYSIKGKPLLNDTIEIKVYTEQFVPMSIADKGVTGNQLKNTIGEIKTYRTYDENGNLIESEFGTDAIGARKVASPFIIGIQAILLDDIKNNVIKLNKE